MLSACSGFGIFSVILSISIISLLIYDYLILYSWEYSTEDDLDGSSVKGKIATYSGAGYYQNLASNSSASMEIIQDLKQNLWIDRGTRVVFFDFSVYNANINLFCIIR